MAELPHFFIKGRIACFFLDHALDMENFFRDLKSIEKVDSMRYVVFF